MKKLMVVALAVVSPGMLSSTMAAEVGIGVSVDRTNQIFIPIEVNPSLRIEPYLRYTVGNEEDDYRSADHRHLTVGAGLFGKKELEQNFNFVYGARVGYVETSEDGDGYEVTPAVSLEYYLIPRLSFAGEASVSYRRLDDSIDFDSRLYEERTDTQSKFMVRFYF
ncbi:hypothetical protein [Agaribacterium haliotis]|uniref:hypothetical protein n=1 Tax=Agaribacterium haliotis TaxID=2013869 RepID=UPI000BB53FAE|nr:hypothetical protein [Agaribacterium haliotis]